MRHRDRAQWALAGVLCGALLVAPAIWNGFPLLQYDTGGYLARWYEGTLVPSRAVTYGLMLNAGAPLAFWPVLLVQAALTIWVIALTLRAHGLGGRPWLMFSVIAVLSIVSTLPWLTSILLTDIFCGLGVLALYLLLMHGAALKRAERIGLIVLVAVAASTHSATMAVLLALMLAAVVFHLVRGRIALAGLWHGLLALVLGAAVVFAGNYIVAQRLTWTPGGFSIAFGRMLQDGIVKRYLDDHCPDPKLQLCAHKNQLPDDADVWFWGSPLFDKLGRFAGLDPEMSRVALASMVEYPGLQLRTALVATTRQLVAVHTGEGVVDSAWHTYGIIERYLPNLVPEMRSARQQHGELSFNAINGLHYPVALLSMILLPLILLFALRRKLPLGIAELAGVCALAVGINAFVCGVLSNPHDRYGARLVWIAVFAILLALASLHRPALRPHSPKRLPSKTRTSPTHR